MLRVAAASSSDSSELELGLVLLPETSQLGVAESAVGDFGGTGLVVGSSACATDTV